MIKLALALTGLQAAWSILCLCRYEFVIPRQETQRLRWSGSFAAFMTLLETALASFAVLAAWGGAGLVALLFSLFQLMGTALVTETCLHCICLTKDGFVIRTHFGRTHECLWEDLRYWGGSTHDFDGVMYLQTTQGRFFLTLLPMQNAAFCSLVTIYRRQHTLSTLPVHRIRLDPFDGHVPDWPGLLFAYGLVLVFLLGTTGFLTYRALTPITAENTTAAIVAFDSWEPGDDGDVYFHADGMRWRVSCNTEALEPVKQACGTGRSYEVYTRLARPDKGPEYHRVFAMTDLTDGTALVSFDHSSAAERKAGLQVAGLFVLMTLGWIALVVRSIQVGRHPERYSKKTLHRYFGPGMVR